MRLTEPGQQWGRWGDELVETYEMVVLCKEYGWTYREYEETPIRIRNHFKAVLRGRNQAHKENSDD